MVMAQEPTPSNHGSAIKVQVQQVLVPVIVTDQKGHFVRDLKARDFQVFEDGVEQKLAAFATQGNAAPELIPSDAGPGPRVAALPPSKNMSPLPLTEETSIHAKMRGRPVALPPPNGESPPRYTYLIVLDTLNSSFANFGQLREALKKLFKEEHGSDSQYALVALGRKTLVVQNMTRDPKVVLAALEDKEITKAISSSEAANLANQQADFVRLLEANCTHSAASTPASRDCVHMGVSVTDSIVARANDAAKEREDLTRNFLNDLRRLTEQLSGMPGRRDMIMASDGFNLQPGRDLFEIMAAYTGKPKYLLNNQADSLLELIRAIVRLATAQNVTFYTLDSRGLYIVPTGGFDATQLTTQRKPGAILPEVQRGMETSAKEAQDPMNYLAQATGGVFYHDSNDLLKGLHQSFADGRRYYLLAYNSVEPNRRRQIPCHKSGGQRQGSSYSSQDRLLGVGDKYCHDGDPAACTTFSDGRARPGRKYSDDYSHDAR